MRVVYALVQRHLSVFGAVEALLVVVFVANQLVEANGIFIPIVHAYLDDVVAVPITLAIARYIMYFMHRATYHTLYSPYQIAIAVAMFSVYFEWYLPSEYDYHYRDYLDIVCYATGGFLYYVLLKKRSGKNWKQNFTQKIYNYKSGKPQNDARF